MRRLILICLFFSMMVPKMVRGEDSTLFLTIKTMEGHSEIKNELRLGNWQNGKDGFDPLDVEAMPNGLFDAYFEIPKENGNSTYLLWRDIRSSNHWEEWKLVLKSPSFRKVEIDWQRFPFSIGGGLLYRLIDPDTGIETDLDKGSGFFSFSISGSKTLLLKSRPR